MDFEKKLSFQRSFNKSRGYSSSRISVSGASTRSSRAASPLRPSTGKNPLSPAPNDAEAEERDKLLQSLLQKRRVLMAGFKEEDLRDVADVVKYGAEGSSEGEPTAPMIIHIRNALTINPDMRKPAYDQVIMSMLMQTTGLKDHLTYCTERDVYTLSKWCTSFVITTDSEHVIATAGTVIDECYIIVKGHIDRYQNTALTAPDLEASVEPTGAKVLEGWVSREGVATMLGLDVLENRKKWSSDLVAHNGACICTIPAIVLKQYVGTGGFRAEDVMECFWKYYKLWEYVYDNTKKTMLPIDPLFAKPVTFTNDFVKLENPPKPPINVTSCARIKCFSPGQEIFTQGNSRDYLYILVMGEGSLVRRFPDWVEDIPQEVNIGLTLYPGDFSFMDGEDKEWAARNRKAHLEQGHLQDEIDGTQDYDSQQNDAYRLLFASKIRNRELIKHRFGVHKNTLIATTRTEVCMVPLSKIAECQYAFKGLLTVAAGKYRLTIYNDEDLIRRYHENRIWGQQKTKIINKTLGTQIEPSKAPRKRSSTSKRSSRRASVVDIGTKSPKPFFGVMGGTERGNSADGVDPNDIDINFSFDKQEQPPVHSTKLISLLNPRQRSPGTRPNSNPSSPTAKLKGHDNGKEVGGERTYRPAIQGVSNTALLVDNHNQALPPGRRSKSPINRNSRNTQQKGGSLSARIQSFVKATAKEGRLTPSPSQPMAPSRPNDLKKSNQSIRARKSGQVVKSVNSRPETEIENTVTPQGHTRANRQLSLINEESLEDGSIAEGSSTSQDAADTRDPKLLTSRNRRQKRSPKKRSPNVQVDDSELSLQAFAEKNADFYVQKFLKKKAEMRLHSGPIDHPISSSRGFNNSGTTSCNIDRGESSSREGTRNNTAESSSRRKMDMDEIISTLTQATVGSR